MEKSAIYIRVSTIHQVDKDSLPFQKEQMINYSKYVLNINEYEVFEDAGYSGKSLERPAVKDMINRIKNGEFTHLLVYKIDRISRNLMDFVSLYEELKKYGVEFISKVEQFDTSTAMGEAMLKITLVFAELERKITSERVTAIMMNRATQGLLNGTPTPYGYIKDKENKIFILNDKELSTVEIIFQKYIELSSTLNVANYLNEIGIKTKGGHLWQASTIKQIIRNPSYKGVYRYNYRKPGRGKIKPENEWIIVENIYPIIVDSEIWDKANNMMDDNYKGNHTNRVKTYCHPLSGILRCGFCGKLMTLSRSSFKSKNPNYIPESTAVCASYTRTKICQLNSYTVSYMHQFLMRYLFVYKDSILESNDLEITVSKLISEFNNLGLKSIKASKFSDFGAVLEDSVESNDVVNHKTKRKKKLLSEKEKYKKALVKLDDIYIFDSTLLSKADYITRRNSITSKLEELEKEIIKLSNETHITNSNFTNITSQFLILTGIKTIKNEKEFNELVKHIEPEVLRGFLKTVFKAVYLENKKITKIVFNNDDIHELTYL